MKGPLANSEQQAMDFEPLPIQSVALSQRHFDQAVEISDRVVTEPRQWQTYLNALALFGLQEWLAEQAPDLTLQWDQCSLYKPEYANLIEAAYGLGVNHFKLCLLAIGGTLEPWIKLPRAVVDLVDFRAHLYLLVKVLEEQGQVQVLSYLRYDQWLARQLTHPLQPQTDWSYRVPTTWFDSNLNRLLLHLQCLEPQAIPLEDAYPQTFWSEDKARQNLVQRLSKTDSVDTPLWHLISWDEGAGVLTSPALVAWLYQVQTRQISLVNGETENTQSLLQPILNAGQWLHNELNDWAQTLGWILLPPFAELRSSTPAPEPLSQALQPVMDEMDLIRKKLSQEGTPIPSDARCIVKDLHLGKMPLRLYAITWLLRDAAGAPVEWVLLPILKKLSDDGAYGDITLVVKDKTNLLTQQMLPRGAENNFIYAQMVGDFEEEFLLTLTSDSGAALSLPPFIYSPDEPS